MIMEAAIDIPSMRIVIGYALIANLLMTSVPVQAQLPAPSRTIYKCLVNGAISYQDDPCLGAQRLDAVPTRGVDRLSGSSRIGADVRGEIWSEQMAKAIRPISGMNDAQWVTATRRQHLDAHSQRECRQLEPAILALEESESRVSGGRVKSVHEELFVLRKRYKKLGC